MQRLNEILENREGSYIFPFFWLKGEDNQTILREIERVQECGIRELCLESRPHPDFCGEGWWKNLDFIMEEARKRQMRIWVLDDRKFPTGYANGAFEKKYPELSKVYLAERHVDLMGPCRSGASLVENFLQPDGELLGILACPKPDSDTLAVSGDGVLNLTEQYRDGFVYYDLPKGAYRLFVLYTTRSGGGREHYMNLIDSESVRVLIDEVYEKHYERYRSDFGKTFAGFFSDEPEIGNVPGYPFDCMPGQAGIRLPWSRQLQEKLQARWGAAFLENLPALWYDMGEKTASVRAQFMDSVSALVYQCFSGQIGAWCREHGVSYIGHIIEDDNAHGRLGCSIGHYFREMKGQDMAGIDVVHHQIVPGFTGKIHQWIAGDSDGEFFHFGLAKLASSAAHLDEKKKGRALCEIFGNYGWAEGVSFMKWLSDHMLVRGINRYTPHAFSMKKQDTDCPPHFYAGGENPQFEAFGYLMRYLNRAAHLLSAGKPVREAAVLYHADAEWSGCRTMLSQKPVRVLMEHQMDADIVPDDLFAEAQVSDGKLKLAAEEYPVLILPGCERIPVQTARFLEREDLEDFPVFAVDFLPDRDTDGRRLGEAFYRRVQLVSLGALADAVRRSTDVFFTPSRFCPDLRSFAVPQPDGVICMFLNESVSQKAELTLYLNRKAGTFRKITRADLWRNVCDSWKTEENTVPLSLEPGESVFLILEEDGNGLPSLPVKICGQTVETAWDVSRKAYGEQQFKRIAKLAPGLEFPNMNLLDPRFAGTYRYEGSFHVKKGENRYLLCLPCAGDIARIFLNGKDCGYIVNFPGRTDITKALADGENTLCIEVTTTLVWERRDGASTHLQIKATGLEAAPVLETWKEKEEQRDESC